jgi:DNA-binding GntR family transcriptional regulator
VPVPPRAAGLEKIPRIETGITLNTVSCIPYLHNRHFHRGGVATMVRPQTLAEQVYQHLLRMILVRELAPGTPLQETDLAARLGVSRTPIREALGRLIEYGVVEGRPNHSAVVRRLGPEELAHLHEVREALEGMAAERACGRLTEADYEHLDALAAAARDPGAPGYFAAFNAFDAELHRIVSLRSGNPIIAREVVKLHAMTLLIHEQLEEVLIESGRIDASERHEIRRLSVAQHLEILEALRSGTPAESRRAMVDHIRSNCDRKVGMMPTARPDGRRPASLSRS